MLIFGTPRLGAYKEVNIAEGYGAILSFSDNQTTVEEDRFSNNTLNSKNVLVTAIQITQREKHSIVSCFSDHNYLYAFGHDAGVSVLRVSAVVLLGECMGQGPASFTKVLEQYRKHRVGGIDPKFGVLTLGTKLIGSGLLVGMESNTADASRGIQTVTFDLALMDPAGHTT